MKSQNKREHNKLATLLQLCHTLVYSECGTHCIEKFK